MPKRFKKLISSKPKPKPRLPDAHYDHVTFPPMYNLSDSPNDTHSNISRSNNAPLSTTSRNNSITPRNTTSTNAHRDADADSDDGIQGVPNRPNDQVQLMRNPMLKLLPSLAKQHASPHAARPPLPRQRTFIGRMMTVFIRKPHDAPLPPVSPSGADIAPWNTGVDLHLVNIPSAPPAARIVPPQTASAAATAAAALRGIDPATSRVDQSASTTYAGLTSVNAIKSLSRDRLTDRRPESPNNPNCTFFEDDFVDFACRSGRDKVGDNKLKKILAQVVSKF